jgi:hypothetical protein
MINNGGTSNMVIIAAPVYNVVLKNIKVDLEAARRVISAIHDEEIVQLGDHEG